MLFCYDSRISVSICLILEWIQVDLLSYLIAWGVVIAGEIFVFDMRWRVKRSEEEEKMTYCYIFSKSSSSCCWQGSCFPSVWVCLSQLVVWLSMGQFWIESKPHFTFSFLFFDRSDSLVRMIQANYSIVFIPARTIGSSNYNFGSLRLEVDGLTENITPLEVCAMIWSKCCPHQ